MMVTMETDDPTRGAVHQVHQGTATDGPETAPGTPGRTTLPGAADRGPVQLRTAAPTGSAPVAPAVVHQVVHQPGAPADARPVHRRAGRARFAALMHQFTSARPLPRGTDQTAPVSDPPAPAPDPVRTAPKIVPAPASVAPPPRRPKARPGGAEQETLGEQWGTLTQSHG